jgi:hypothetical protein
VVLSALSFDDQAQNPNADEIFDDFAGSGYAGSCSGRGAGIVLDAIGDGPSLGKADAPAAATSLFALARTQGTLVSRLVPTGCIPAADAVSVAL